MSGQSYNPYITNIVPLFNVPNSASGTITNIDYTNQIAGFGTMIDYNNYVVSADTIQGISDTIVNINSDVIISGNLIVNSYPLGPDVNGSNFTSGTGFTVETTNLSNINMQFIVNGINALTITSNANSIFSGTITCENVVQVSDRRLKSDIINISNSLSTLLELEAVQYTMNKESRLGFIAQDVYEVIPKIVNTSNTYWSIDYTQIIPLLVESIKELSAEIKSLRKRH
jgi:hypothetical protein